MRQERLFALLTLFSFFFSVALLFHFSAEDSYITLRYARNLYEGHGPVFNIGDRINAMTSPWHVLFSAVLFAFTDHVDLLNKALGLVYLLLSAWMVSLPFAGNVALRLLVAALASASASAVLWAVGGLETPLLMALVSATVPLVVAPTIRKPWPCWRWPALAVLASLGFLTRYDSVLFFGPLLLGVAIAEGFEARVLRWLVFSALLPLAWLAFSYAFFGDLLPTSFYVKHPSTDLISSNLKYILVNLVQAGPGWLLPLLLLLPGAPASSRWRSAAGLAFPMGIVLCYASSMATVHMMFGFRALVPYFGVMATIVGLLALSRGTSRTVLLGLLAALLLTDGLVAWRYMTRSLQGYSTIGEYQHVNVQDYEAFMGVLSLNAGDVREHWASLKGHASPRLSTFAAGVLPYELGLNFYIYEALVSWRRPAGTPTLKDLRACSDYIHVLSPRHGTAAAQLEGLQGLQLISDHKMRFDGSEQSFQVYWNSNPKKNLLSDRVDR